MFNKKIILPFAALAMASFVACGDDSSSSPSNDTPSTTPSTTNSPASVQTLEDAINLTCSQTVNMCAKVYVVEENDTVQCNGTIFTPMTFGKPVEGCENGAANTPTTTEDPATQEPTTENPGAEDPADPGAGEEPAGPGAGEEPAGPGAGEEPAGPGAGEEPAGPGAGDRVYCLKEADFACAEGPASFASGCSEDEGEVLVDKCPAGGEACDIGENNIIMHLYEGYGMTCEQMKAFMGM